MSPEPAHYRAGGVPFCKLPKRVARFIARKSAALLARDTADGHAQANAKRAVGQDVPLVCRKCAAIVWPVVEKHTGERIAYAEVQS
jgi:hypothetical protein